MLNQSFQILPEFFLRLKFYAIAPLSFEDNTENQYFVIATYQKLLSYVQSNDNPYIIPRYQWEKWMDCLNSVKFS